MAGVLEAVMECAVLVQGCWAVSSHVVFPESNKAAKRNARDYIYCKREVVRWITVCRSG